jgi:hypothetical protein
MLFRRRGTIIAEGLKITGNVAAEGMIQVNGQIDGEVHCTSLFISPKASIHGSVEAERVVVNGRVEGPIHGSEVGLNAFFRLYAQGARSKGENGRLPLTQRQTSCDQTVDVGVWISVVVPNLLQRRVTRARYSVRGIILAKNPHDNGAAVFATQFTHGHVGKRPQYAQCGNRCYE